MTPAVWVTSDEYHQDQVGTPEPSLSSTIARVLLSRTPAHAKAAHPRLSDTPLEPRTSDAMDMGTAVHQLLLKDDRVDVAGFENYRKGEAQTWRDEVRANGRIPMLQHQWDKANAIANAIRENVKQLAKPTPFTAGTPEATLTWQEGDSWLRARLDWLRDDLDYIDDLKLTSRSADQSWDRQIWNMGYDIQAALYIRGVVATQGVQPTFRWIVAESYPPYAVSAVTLDEADLFAANVQIDAALQVWRECMASGVWPAYPVETRVAVRPGWARAREDRWGEVDVEEAVPF